MTAIKIIGIVILVSLGICASVIIGEHESAMTETHFRIEYGYPTQAYWVKEFELRDGYVIFTQGGTTKYLPIAETIITDKRKKKK